jgi:hypothetical protein
MNKEERLQYIKECAANIRAEKARAAKLYETETEIAEQFGYDLDFMTMENIHGFIMDGVQKVEGGLRHIPVIIL